jgi:hypothetical protein
VGHVKMGDQSPWRTSALTPTQLLLHLVTLLPENGFTSDICLSAHGIELVRPLVASLEYAGGRSRRAQVQSRS